MAGMYNNYRLDEGLTQFTIAAIYTVYTSPTHPPIPNHLPTLIVTPHGMYRIFGIVLYLLTIAAACD